MRTLVTWELQAIYVMGFNDIAKISALARAVHFVTLNTLPDGAIELVHCFFSSLTSLVSPNLTKHKIKQAQHLYSIELFSLWTLRLCNRKLALDLNNLQQRGHSS